MKMDSLSDALVILNTPPGLEETVVDWLLERKQDAGFTSIVAHGHSTRHSHMSVAEQVSGRQRRLQFHIQMPSSDIDEFLDSLAASLGGSDIHYDVVPVLRSGRLGK